MSNIAGVEAGEGTRFETTSRAFGHGTSSVVADVVVGPYRVLEVLGEGASSRVYVAEHLEDGRRVALKLMLPCHGDSLTKVMRFQLECELLERLSHPNVVKLIEHGHCEERYAAIELLHGETLRQRLVRESVLTLRESLGIGIQLADALEAVHSAGVIHCDVKPDNLFLAQAGFGAQILKLYDFDAARWIDKNTGRSTSILPHGAVLGTPGYMAPEQEQGAHVDHRADIYAFGVVLYEMLTNACPYGQTTSFSDIVRTRFFGAPKPLRAFRHLNELPPSVDTLVRRCIERVPERRPCDMREVSGKLRDVARDVDDGSGWDPGLAA